MRVAVISDIHGNLPALEAVLAEIGRERADLVVCCGDVASGPMPAETIGRLKTIRPARFVMGNADESVIEEFDGRRAPGLAGSTAEWCAQQIDRGGRDFLAAFEARVTIDGVDGLGRVMFCHATPHNDTDVFSAVTPEERVLNLFGTVEADLVVCGHTHMQFDRRVGTLRVVNAGSVGMPYGSPGAYWAMLGPGIDLRRTEYDREGAARAIRAKDWDRAAEFAAENVVSVPSLVEALTFIREAEAKQLG